MPVQLRDNLGNRLVLRVESIGTSKIALGEEGAERLLGKGHMAARLPDSNGIIFAQVPYLDPNDLRDIVLAIREDSEPDASDPLQQPETTTPIGSETTAAEAVLLQLKWDKSSARISYNFERRFSHAQEIPKALRAPGEGGHPAASPPRTHPGFGSV
jgi:DNA segregation ATPase FtsK/SpoIIIE-like protein